ncbi:hypothetical protein Tco_1482473 [Tanacetum coccineum]
MELQDIISSSLRKDMKELQQLQERLKEIKEECNKNIQRIQKDVEYINPGSTPWNKKVFQILFGKEFHSFRQGFVRIMDHLEIQLATEEGFKDLIIRYLNGIEKGIDARASHEEVL